MRVWILGAVLTLTGCKGNEVKSEALRLSWKPPSGVSLAQATDDALTFTNGVEIHSIQGKPLDIEEGKLDPLMLMVLAAAHLDPLPTRISGRLGTIPAGIVARWVLAGGGQRALHYYLPLKGRFLVISMAAPEGVFGTRENQLDLSLSTLKIE